MSTHIEAFIPLGGGGYVTARVIVNRDLEDIDLGNADQVIVRFAQLDDQDIPVPGLHKGFCAAYDRAEPTDDQLELWGQES